MNRSPYLRLQLGEIRLLKLLPAKDETQQIRCELLPTPLQSAPAYEAISYEWNSVPGTALVDVPTGRIKVSRSLEHALRGMRGKEKARMLWADGICIDQSNDEELRSQLSIMEKVYEMSQVTLVWLGCATRDTALAIEVLHSLALFARQRNAHTGMDKNDYRAFILYERPERSGLFIDDDDGFLVEMNSRGRCSVTQLLRKADLSDNEIFRFQDHQLWCEIDGMFSNSYFERTWIQREVAKAPYVSLCRGPYMFSWPLFTSAFIGRNLMMFHYDHQNLRFTGPLHTVIDARERWRTPEHFTTLAGALVTLSYSKETQIQDHIYAAYAMSKHKIPWLEESSSRTDIEKLMLRTAWACIEERGDLYHLGQWCVTSRKRMNLPTWAPDFTSGTCELAVEYASEGTSKLIEGSYNPCGELLCLDAHLLDTIEWSHDINSHGDLQDILEIVQGLERIFRRQGKGGVFQEYAVPREGWIPRDSPENSKQELLRQLLQAHSVLRTSTWCPESCLDQLKVAHNSVERQSASPSCQLVIEALWLLLNPSSRIRERYTNSPGEHLFLALLYVVSMQARQGFSISCAELPKAYGVFIFALMPVVLLGVQCSDEREVIEWTTKFIREHIIRTKISGYEKECVFVTKRGFLGRTAAGEASKGDVISILGGGWTPYILKQNEQFYSLKSFAYIEGLAEIRKKPANWKIERICLR